MGRSPRDQDIGAGGFIVVLLQPPGRAARIVAPILSFTQEANGILQVDLDALAHGLGVDIEFPVITRGGGQLGVPIYRDRQHVTQVVVGVFTDEIDSARRTYQYTRLSAETFCEGKLSCHVVKLQFVCQLS